MPEEQEPTEVIPDPTTEEMYALADVGGTDYGTVVSAFGGSSRDQLLLRLKAYRQLAEALRVLFGEE